MCYVRTTWLVGLLLLAPLGSEATDLTVAIERVTVEKGSLLVALCVAETYDDPETCPYTIKTRAKIPRATVVYVNVDPGVYSVQVFHDENDNGEFDTNLFGIPTEGFAFSNDAHGSFGPPTFEDTTFRMNSADRKLTLNLEY